MMAGVTKREKEFLGRVLVKWSRVAMQCESYGGISGS